MFSKRTDSKCFSIEENIDFENYISKTKIVVFAYPIYGSCVPLIMRNFVYKYKEKLNGKKLIILVTQNLFSGDGARVFTDLLKGINYEVIYAEHFNMPNNICNISFYPLSSSKKSRKYIIDAHKKIDKIINNLNNGVIKKEDLILFLSISG